MIRVEIEEENRAGRYVVCVPSHRLCVKSRQPLLDACRTIKRMGGDTGAQIGLFRKGRENPDLVTTVEVGAGLTVHETPKTKLMKFKEFGGLRNDAETEI